MLTSKPLPAAGPQSKLVLLQGLVGFQGSTKLAQSTTEGAQRVQMSGGGDVQVRAESSPIDQFVRWFNLFSADLSTEKKKEALFACHQAATSLIENEWYNDEVKLSQAKATST